MNFIKKLIPQSIKNIYHLIQAILANLWFGWPSRNIKVIGVTGTNGKTTTVQMIAKILEEAPSTSSGQVAKKVAAASTINFKIGDKVWVNTTKFTTLSAWAVQKFIKQAVKAGCEYLVLETSSHSLDQYRVWGVKYQTAVITNVTREHLDYHKTIDEYRSAKTRLFKNIETAVVNLDMIDPEEFIENVRTNKIYEYTTGIQNSKFKNQSYNSKFKIIKAEKIKLETVGSSYKIYSTNFKLNLPGLFNIENALAAACVGLAENISLEIISRALEKITNIPGRLESVENNRGLNIIIDYAVTPDSLEKLYELIKNIRVNSPDIRSDSRVISVFGACGERDRGKRPMMGEIVSKAADYVLLTNEDSYNEDPQQIINEIFSGIKNKQENINLWRILDRREAIKKALQLAKPGDYIIVTGKGAEVTMAVGKERISWNDKKVILEELKKLA